MLRELDERTADNLRVTLYWQDEDNTLVVGVEDFNNPTGGHALTGIPPTDAKLAFEHPFGYRPGIALSTAF
ncbi:MAG TPA: hypothetical protein VMU39_10425 [Solirubrobacteraceae bacterium]|nr:hypothetical protein [Solirubrobacteraceae bacterium]